VGEAVPDPPLQRANVAIVIAKFFKKLKCYRYLDLDNIGILTEDSVFNRILFFGEK
jgi:hypothetical protein